MTTTNNFIDATSKGTDVSTSLLGKSYQNNQKVTSAWLPNGAVLTQGFGVMESLPQFGINAPHQGIDLAGKNGDPINLPAGTHAVVQEAGWDPYGAGNFVKLLLDDGSTVQLFHMKAINVVQGQDLTGSQLLGWMDTTGDSTGPHVHFQLDNPSGISIDPWNLIEGVGGAGGGAGGIGGIPNPLDALKNVNDFFGHLVSPGHDICSPPSSEVGVLRVADALSCPQNWWKVLFVVVGGILIFTGGITYFFKEEKQVVVNLHSDLGEAAEAAAVAA
jgi:hypothetical protein